MAPENPTAGWDRGGKQNEQQKIGLDREKQWEQLVTMSCTRLFLAANDGVFSRRADANRPPDNEPDDSTSARSDKPPRSIMGWLARHKLLAAIIGGALLITGYIRLMGPSVNSNPVQKITIRGKFPYSEGFDLELQPSFYSTNPTCKQTARVFLIFAAADVHREARLPVRVTRDGGDHYTAELYLDHFSPGFCDWKYGGMGFRISGAQQSDTAVHGLGPVPDRQNRVDMVCRLRSFSKSDRRFVFCQKSSLPYFDQKLGSSAEINFVLEKD